MKIHYRNIRKIVNRFLDKINDKELLEEFKSYYIKEYNSSYIETFHVFCEDNRMWEDYIDFQEEEKNMVIRWWEENDIKYTTNEGKN